MRDLEERMASWRQEMIVGGVTAPEVLDELESHLRDDVEERMGRGATMEDALDLAVQRLGRAAVLENEFEKIGESRGAPERAKQMFLTLAGIPNHYVNEPMNTFQTEPRWATYLKAGAFLAPAVILWAMSVVFVIPKLQQISLHAGGHPLPVVVQLMVGLTHYGLWIALGIGLVLFLLEWRSQHWPRYRRAAVGVGTFVLNAVVLITIFMMVITAILVAPALMRHG